MDILTMLPEKLTPDMLTVLLVPAVHEFGHWITARLFGASLVFSFAWGRIGPIKVPRWTWPFPDVPRNQLRLICFAGFALELGIAPLMPQAYQVAAAAHFLLYPFYAGRESDWKGVF